MSSAPEEENTDVRVIETSPGASGVIARSTSVDDTCVNEDNSPFVICYQHKSNQVPRYLLEKCSEPPEKR